MNSKQSGFTLIEIMIAIAILAILAAIALPQYGIYVTRAALVEAHAGLGGYRVLMEQYYQDNRNYGVGVACGAPAVAYKNFTHSCTLGATDQTYIATATGNASSRAEGFTFTINQVNARATTAVPTGWTAAANCFIVNKRGDC
jgi:type IV pilus assembly protein PilE